MKISTVGSSSKQKQETKIQVLRRHNQKLTQPSAWYKTCRPHLEWVNWSPDVKIDEYADELIRRAKDMNSDTLVYPWESGGYLLYPGELAPPYENLNGHDLLGILINKTKAAGLRFVICFLGLSANTYLTQTHSDWVQKDKDGKLIEKWHGYQFRSMCPNSPYGQYLEDIAGDLLKRYPLDGIYIEGVYMGSGYCYCPYCRERYQEMFGTEMPTENLKTHLDYNRFRQESFVKAFRHIHDAIKNTKPDTAFFACIGYTYYFGTQGDSAFNIRDLADVIGIESQWNYDLPSGYDPSFAPTLQETGMIMQIMRAESKKPALGTVWIGKHVDQNYAPRSEANVILNFQELLINGAIAQVHTQNAFEVDPALEPTLQRLYSDAEKVMPYLSDAKILTHTAILNWADIRNQHRYYDDSLKGAYKAMLESHIPTRIISPDEIAAKEKTDFDVLLLANSTTLDDDVVDNIAAYVESGGGLVLTYQSLLANKKLETLAGVTHIKSVIRSEEEFPLHTYYRIESGQGPWKELNNTLMSFVANHEVVECQEGTVALGHILSMAPDRKSENHILQVCYPGKPSDPLITIHQAGKGRVVYLAAELCAAARRYGDKNTLDVLSAAVKYAGGAAMPVKTNCPPCVEIVTHQKDNKLAVMLLNQTTNQYMADPVRYVVPIHDIEITLKLNDSVRKPKQCNTISGQKPYFNIADGYLSVYLSKLTEYDGILLDF